MSTVRIALANVRVPATAQDSVLLATSTVAEAGRQGALVVCFPECFQPYGQAGLLVADLDLLAATGLLASRCRTNPM
jgi:predicted amidohydrolase